MNSLIQTFTERKEQLASALIEHISISLIALLLAMLIAIPLAIWLVRYKKMAEVMLQVTGVLQTIPSLALLGLLIPFVGIGTPPAIIALVIYALLPIFQNTYIGLSEIDPSLEEAADAFGMSRMRKLRKVELPIALPVIISGIRTALVLIIGTATLAALIGAGGLGTFILLGIDRNDTNLILIGAISSALLAIIFSTAIRLLQKARPRTTLISLAALFLLLGGIGLSQSQMFQKETVTIAGKLGAEPDILINMYKELIEAETEDVTVELKPNFGKTSFLFSALEHNQIDIYPEFTGTVLESLVEVPKAQQGQVFSSEETYELAKKLLAEQYQMDFLAPMAYQNTYALAVKRSFAEEHELKTISDLIKVQDQLHAGFTLEFIDRSDGYKGIQEKYQLNFEVSSMEPALRYTAINNGDVNLIDAYSTDSEIKQYDLVTLEDDQHLFPPYQGAPVLRQDFAEKHPKIVASLEKLKGQITEDEMIDMNYAVNVEGQQPDQVAHDYLVKKGLIGGGQQ
ncbi:glycine betaine/carnitine/choline ABC transporter [Enterococcus canis]|uniref:Glycine betaine/carnitine/choline ABC transporter n=1 Tax=Enterococcus canis TaxID=214095 RepID=A0A1L8RKI4_9ENTE|nr:ABC transporter permease/substrate-binding protein [Enterococcus canis]OJG20290.1 glycine betaine/carnitine/choline ABC transporter [Enterococcus canis]